MLLLVRSGAFLLVVIHFLPSEVSESSELCCHLYLIVGASKLAQWLKKKICLTVQETQEMRVQSLGQEDS